MQFIDHPLSRGLYSRPYGCAYLGIRVTSCAFCGRDNEPDSRFCIDCGKPMNPSAARVGPAYVPQAFGGQPQPANPPAVAARPPAASFSAGLPPTRISEGVVNCPRCGKPSVTGLPFCGHCGTLVGRRVSVEAGTGTPQKVPLATAILGSAGRIPNAPRLSLLGETGEPTRSYTLDRGEAVIGRGDADMRFEDDPFMSPLHARLEARNGLVYLRDLGSRNGTWVFIDQPSKLTDCDLILVGSQLIRFRRLGYPGPHPPEADSTRRMGSAVPTVDVAVLEQIRADGSVRDTFHLSPGRPIIIGRESGDWIFPYDATMSGRHAEVRTEDSEFFVHDANSRNGVAMSVRGERELKKSQRMLVGDQILRLESV
jgi:pSer/pThr/pTyr-binding forkhead associated (FHA) protein